MPNNSFGTSNSTSMDVKWFYIGVRIEFEVIAPTRKAFHIEFVQTVF